MNKNIDVNNEKVKKIINAAYKEFAVYGEAKASLNKILKVSGISKGVFYHHFKDKEELFSFLMSYSFTIGLENIDKKLNWDDDDIIRRICDIAKYKLSVTKEYPYMIEFYDMFKDSMLIEKDKIFYRNWREKFYTLNIDYSKFKDKTKLKEYMHIIRWTYKGLGIELLHKYGNVLEDETISMLKKKFDEQYLVLSSHFYKIVK